MSSPDVWQLTIPWEPWAKKRPRISKSVAGRSRRTHQPADDRKAEERTNAYLEEHWEYPTLTGNIWLTLRFWRSSRQVVDGDNLLKHLLDAAHGIIFVNDTQVTAVTYALDLDRENPRTELWVEEHDTGLYRDYS